MSDVVVVQPDDQDPDPGPDPLTLLHDRIQSLEERLAEKADREHAHDQYATHDQLQGYAPADHQHDQYVSRGELDTELDELVADIDDDLEEALGLDEDAQGELTTIEPVTQPEDDEPSHRVPGLFW